MGVIAELRDRTGQTATCVDRLTERVEGLESALTARIEALEARSAAELADVRATADLRAAKLEKRFDFQLTDLRADLSSAIYALQASVLAGEQAIHDLQNRPSLWRRIFQRVKP